MNNSKITNIIFWSILVSLCGAFSFQMYKLSTYKNSIESLKENLFNTTDTNENSNEDSLYESIDNVAEEDINYDTGAALEQENPPNYYTLDITNLEVLESYIPNENNQLLEVYSTISNILIGDLNKNTTAYIDESSISLNGSILSLSLIDVNTRNVIKDFEIEVFIPNSNKNTDEFIVTVSNLNVLEDFVVGNAEGLVKISYEITESLKEDIKDDITCYIDASTVGNKDGILSFVIKDSSTKKAIKTVSIKL